MGNLQIYTQIYKNIVPIRYVFLYIMYIKHYASKVISSTFRY